MFVALQRAITGITNDRRLQLLLIAFCFGAFFEGAAGFGTPVAVTGAMLIGLGFPPLEASALSLIANTAPVAFGALGTPVIALQGVTGLDLGALSAMIGRQLPFFSLIVPFWLIAAYSGLRGMLELWPALLVAGVVVRDAAVSRVELSRAVAGRHRRRGVLDGVPRRCSCSWRGGRAPSTAHARRRRRHAPRDGSRFRFAPRSCRGSSSTVIVFAWGTPQVKRIPQRHLGAEHSRCPGSTSWCCARPPVVAKPTAEPAVFLFNWLSASRHGDSHHGDHLRPRAALLDRARWCATTCKTIAVVWQSLLTIAAMLALGLHDALLGRGRDPRSRVRAHRRRSIRSSRRCSAGSASRSRAATRRRTCCSAACRRSPPASSGLSPVLMAAANSSGGVMGKMIDAQSICVASTATGYVGHEWRILRFVFLHSIALAALVGLLVMLPAVRLSVHADGAEVARSTHSLSGPAGRVDPPILRFLEQRQSARIRVRQVEAGPVECPHSSRRAKEADGRSDHRMTHAEYVDAADARANVAVHALEVAQDELRPFTPRPPNEQCASVVRRHRRQRPVVGPHRPVLARAERLVRSVHVAQRWGIVDDVVPRERCAA